MDNNLMNNKTKDLQDVSSGISIMFGIFWLYSFFIKQYLSISAGFKTVLGLVILYVLGLGIFIFMTHKKEACTFCLNGLRCRSLPYVEKNRISFKTILLCFLLQFTSVLVLTVVVNITTALGFNINSSDIDSTSPDMIFMLLIFNPIIEEVVFRKLFADKLLKYGERFYILVSSFCFAIVHGVSLGIPHIIYTFILGIIWSYLVVKTGNIKLAIIMHALSNFFGSIIIQILFEFSMLAAGIYSLILMILGLTGFILLLINKDKIVLDGDIGLIKKPQLKELLANKGVLSFIALTVIAMTLNGH